jgi:hypothetical protein
VYLENLPLKSFLANITTTSLSRQKKGFATPDRHQIILFESKLFQESRKEVTWKIMNPPTDKPIYFFL